MSNSKMVQLLLAKGAVVDDRWYGSVTPPKSSIGFDKGASIISLVLLAEKKASFMYFIKYMGCVIDNNNFLNQTIKNKDMGFLRDNN